MAHRNAFSTFALITLTVLPLGAIGCSEGQSPTEPAAFDTASTTAPVTSVSDASRRGGNDNANDDNNNNRRRRGRGGNNSGNNGGNNGGGAVTPQAGREFEGAVRAVNGNGVTLASGVRIVVNAQTQWAARGDLFSLSEVAASKAAGHAPRVEGRGARQADGSIVAASIKAEDNR
jgi:hypothetical protein